MWFLRRSPSLPLKELQASYWNIHPGPLFLFSLFQLGVNKTLFVKWDWFPRSIERFWTSKNICPPCLKEKVIWSSFPRSDNTEIHINSKWGKVIPVDSSEWVLIIWLKFVPEMEPREVRNQNLEPSLRQMLVTQETPLLIWPWGFSIRIRHFHKKTLKSCPAESHKSV